MPDRDHWSASMLLCWVLTRDSNVVLSMVDHYGGWLVEGDNVTRTRPQSWDDVLRRYSIDDSLPPEEKAVEAVVKAELFVIPAWNEIYSSLRRGKIDSWARPNGSGDIVKIEPIQWAGLRFRIHNGHDIAVPVDSEQNPLPLPRPLADYVSGSVPPTSLPTVWPDPLFLAEHATRVWEPRAVVEVSSAPPPITPFQEGRATVTDFPAATSAASSQDAATWWPTTNVVDWVQQRELALMVEQVLDVLENRCVWASESTRAPSCVRFR